VQIKAPFGKQLSPFFNIVFTFLKKKKKKKKRKEKKRKEKFIKGENFTYPPELWPLLHIPSQWSKPFT
jgi:hypothetical protein